MKHSGSKSKHIHPEELIPTTIVRDRMADIKEIGSLTKGKTVVDIGAGTGFFSEKISSDASRVYSIDISMNNIRTGAEIIDEDNVYFINADAHNLPICSESVDVVFCSAVVEHLDDPEQFYMELRRILKPGGFVFQSVDIMPSVTCILYKLTFLFDKLYSNNHPMLHKKNCLSDTRCDEFISPEKLKQLVSQHFLIIDDEKYAGLNFNLIHTPLVIANKLFQIATGHISDESSYGDQIHHFNHFIFRIYLLILPVVKKLVHPRLLTFDSLFYHMLLQKKQ